METATESRLGPAQPKPAPDVSGLTLVCTCGAPLRMQYARHARYGGIEICVRRCEACQVSYNEAYNAALEDVEYEIESQIRSLRK